MAGSLMGEAFLGLPDAGTCLVRKAWLDISDAKRYEPSDVAVRKVVSSRQRMTLAASPEHSRVGLQVAIEVGQGACQGDGGAQREAHRA